jgi:hypothetical protein
LEQIMKPADTAAALEVTVDGHHDHFRQYRYEQLDDALRYAGTQQLVPAFRRGPASRPQRLPLLAPDEAQQVLMRELDIGFAAGRVNIGPFRYDRLDDAVAYARHIQLCKAAPG